MLRLLKRVSSRGGKFTTANNSKDQRSKNASTALVLALCQILISAVLRDSLRESAKFRARWNVVEMVC